jgi:hypothetical protein
MFPREFSKTRTGLRTNNPERLIEPESTHMAPADCFGEMGGYRLCGRDESPLSSRTWSVPPDLLTTPMGLLRRIPL